VLAKSSAMCKHSSPNAPASDSPALRGVIRFSLKPAGRRMGHRARMSRL
jgi:hypothetical protein